MNEINDNQTNLLKYLYANQDRQIMRNEFENNGINTDHSELDVLAKNKYINYVNGGGIWEVTLKPQGRAYVEQINRQSERERIEDYRYSREAQNRIDEIEIARKSLKISKAALIISIIAVVIAAATGFGQLILNLFPTTI